MARGQRRAALSELRRPRNTRAVQLPGQQERSADQAVQVLRLKLQSGARPLPLTAVPEPGEPPSARPPQAGAVRAGGRRQATGRSLPPPRWCADPASRYPSRAQRPPTHRRHRTVSSWQARNPPRVVGSPQRWTVLYLCQVLCRVKGSVVKPPDFDSGWPPALNPPRWHPLNEKRITLLPLGAA